MTWKCLLLLLFNNVIVSVVSAASDSSQTVNEKQPGDAVAGFAMANPEMKCLKCYDNPPIVPQEKSCARKKALADAQTVCNEKRLADQEEQQEQTAACEAKCDDPCPIPVTMPCSDGKGGSKKSSTVTGIEEKVEPDPKADPAHVGETAPRNNDSSS